MYNCEGSTCHEQIQDEDALLKLCGTSGLPSEIENEANCFDELKALRLKYPRNVMTSYINTNSVRNKFTDFSEMVGDYIDILVISETKIDSSFPTSQFVIDGFKSPYRLNVSRNSSGVLVYVRDSLLSKQLNVIGTQPDIQVVPFDINVRKQKMVGTRHL